MPDDRVAFLRTAAPFPAEDQRLIAEIAQARAGGQLPEPCRHLDICRMFGVSARTALRVLRQLTHLGLVTRKTGHGWSFPQPADVPRLLAESLTFRQIIEPACVLQATFALDRDWLEQIKQRHITFRQQAWHKTLMIELYTMNSDFHEGLARCSNNGYLLHDIQRQIQLRAFLSYRWEYTAGRVQGSIDEHLAIIAALERGDNEQAAALMRRHLNQRS